MQTINANVIAFVKGAVAKAFAPKAQLALAA